MNIIKYGGSAISSQEDLVRIGDIIGSGSDSVVIFSAAKRLSREIRSAVDLAAAGRYDNDSDSISTIRVILECLTNDEKYVEYAVAKLNRLFTAISYTGEPHPSTIDKVLSLGEIITSEIIRAYLDKNQFKYMHFNSSQKFITNNNFGQAEPIIAKIKEKLQQYLNSIASSPIIMEGFIGSTEEGDSTTMGFESSNLTAIVTAHILDVSSIKYISKVDAIYTADPFLYNAPLKLSYLNLYDAKPLSKAGTRILHLDTLEFADDNGITLHYCGADLAINTTLGKTHDTEYPVISYLGTSITEETNDSYGILTILIPKKFSATTKDAIEYLNEKSESISIDKVRETKSQLLRVEISGLSVEDIEELHRILGIGKA